MLLCAYPMAQAASRRLVIAEARVQSQGSPWIGGHWDTFFSPSTLVVPCQYHSPITDAVQSQQLTASVNNTTSVSFRGSF
jgi:hypothetical protein